MTFKFFESRLEPKIDNFTDKLMVDLLVVGGMVPCEREGPAWTGPESASHRSGCSCLIDCSYSG